jgi:carotenoid cleavage dioxygenase
MSVTIVNRVASTIGATEHPYMTGAWTPNFDEIDAPDLEVIGEIPRELDGVYLRNTENPVHAPIGLYHPFDGDGMIHAISFRDGKAGYCNRFVRTKGGRRRSGALGRSRGEPGALAPARLGRAGQPEGQLVHRRCGSRGAGAFHLLPVRGGIPA